MDEKLEQAAKECADSFVLTDFYMGSDIKEAIMEAFEAGANWQKEQSPWIGVQDNLPPERVNVLVRSEYEGESCFDIAYIMDEKWVTRYSKPTHWMPIPE